MWSAWIPVTEKTHKVNYFHTGGDPSNNKFPRQTNYYHIWYCSKLATGPNFAVQANSVKPCRCEQHSYKGRAWHVPLPSDPGQVKLWVGWSGINLYPQRLKPWHVWSFAECSACAEPRLHQACWGTQERCCGSKTWGCQTGQSTPTPTPSTTKVRGGWLRMRLA